MEQQPELVAVHRADNGVIDVIPDSGAARVGKTALMTLGTGPFGSAAGVLTRDMRAECSKCRKVFGRSTYSRVHAATDRGVRSERSARAVAGCGSR